MEVNKKELKEQEIRTLFITPALQQKGWAVSVNMREEYYFTDGRVLVVGNQHSVAEGKKADYLLYHKGKPIAVVEAKDNKHAVGGGIQQAMDYAQILDLKCRKSLACTCSHHYKYTLLSPCNGFHGTVNRYALIVSWFVAMGIIIKRCFYNIKFIRCIVLGCKITIVQLFFCREVL